jgi:hypothetical protein
MTGLLKARAKGGDPVATANVVGRIDQCDEVHATVLLTEAEVSVFAGIARA